MSFGKGNKYEIRHRALLEAIRFCGGVTAYSNRLKVSRTRASNWCNRPEIEIPYEYVVLTEDITQVSIERLSPFTESANKVIRRLRAKDKPLPINMEFSEILMGELPYLKHFKPESQIIIGTDGVLISGFKKIETQKALGIRKTQVTVLDLEALLIENRSISDMNLDLLISEKIAIGLRLEQLLGNRQGQRNDLRSRKIETESNSNTELHRICDEVTSNKGKLIAYIIGLSSKDKYYRARQVFLHGDSELIDKLDKKEISIAMAAKIAINSPNLKQDREHMEMQGVKSS